jgi:uncharacterized protein
MSKKVEIRRLTDDEVQQMNINSWPIWEKGVSRFPWTYAGAEECLILEGKFIVETEDGNYEVGPGDFVRFSDGLSCVWDIKKPVKKHYNFP